MYIPLYNKSNYSLLSSLLKIDDIISYATNNHLNSIAITDFNMFGTMEFIKKCEKANIKPIIGLEIKQALIFQATKQLKGGGYTYENRKNQ